jgi:hypothetical protein
MGGGNFYPYVTNRPADLIDPGGLFPRPITPYRWVPCNAAETAECRTICGARGMESCRASETWRFIRYKDGFSVHGWKRGPMSCSCHEECNKQPEKQPQEKPFRIPIIDPIADWLNEKLHYPFKGPAWDKVRDWQWEFERGPRPVPGWGPLPGPLPVPIPVPVPVIP